MNKLYSLLTAAAICSAASGLVASERPFFDQETQEVVKKTAKNYALGYAGMYGAGTGFAVIGTALVAPRWVRNQAVGWSLKRVHSNVYKGITRSIVPKVALSFPIVLSSALARHKHQQSKKA